MSCPRCDAPTAPGARFCPECGARLADDPTTQAAPVAAAVDDEPLFGETADDEPLFGRPAEDEPLFGGSTDEPSSATDTLVSCPACGAANSEARMLCGSCGVDLVTGEQAVDAADVVQPGPAVDVVGPVDLGERRDGPRTAMVVAAIVVVGALVGVAVGVWAIRAGQQQESAAPAFDAGVYPGDPVDLRVGGVGASSTRTAAGETEFVPANMVDADLSTSWSHDPQTQAATEVDLAFALEQPAWVTSVIVANGAQTDADSFAADGRIASMLLVVDDDPVVELVLLDEQGYQEVVLPEPVLASTVRFVVEEVVAGDTFPEISLSEVAFVGHPATGADLDRLGG